MNRTRTIITVILAATLLAGCAPRDAEPTPPPVAETPVETPTPEPTKPELADLVLSPKGLGDLAIGEAPPQTNPEVDTLIFDEDFCAEDVASGAITEPGKWIANYPTDGTDYAQFPFAALVLDGVVKNLVVDDPLIQTEGGIGVGSSLDELLAAHPDAVRIPKTYMDLYVIAGTSGQLVFEVGTQDSIGYDPDIIWIAHVISNDEEPYSWANSDVGFTGCTFA